jgi:hypothetical protein
MRDPHSEDSRGFGFINFSNSDDADAALALNGMSFMGKTLIVQKVILYLTKARRSRARTPTPGQYRGPIKERRGKLYIDEIWDHQEIMTALIVMIGPENAWNGVHMTVTIDSIAQDMSVKDMIDLIQEGHFLLETVVILAATCATNQIDTTAALQCTKEIADIEQLLQKIQLKLNKFNFSTKSFPKV